MAKGQDSGTTILLRLKGYQVGEVWEEDEIYLGIDEHSFRHREMVHTKLYLQNPLFGSQSIPPQM